MMKQTIRGKKENPTKLRGDLIGYRSRTMSVVSMQQENTLVELNNFDSTGEVDDQFDAHSEQSEAVIISRISPSLSFSAGGVLSSITSTKFNQLESSLYNLPAFN
jgi:hypothetical protein